jgi:uncharacterized protein YfaS (alpha-2-macroglobulin family)
MLVVGRQTLLITVSSLLLVFLTSFANSASFNCDNAASKTEKMICSNPDLSIQDSKLGQLYSQLESTEKSKKSQRQWIKNRNLCADSACLETSYQLRIIDFEALLLTQQYAGQPQKITSIKEENWNNGGSIVIRVTVPIDANSDWRRLVTLKVTADDKNWLEQNFDNWIMDSGGLALIFPFVEPNKNYNVSIQPGLKGINGATLAQPSNLNIKTRRTQPSASFSGDGHVLSNKIRRALPVTTLNVDEVDIEIFRILPEYIGTWINYSHQERERSGRLNHLANETTMVYSGRFPIKHLRNQRTTTNVDLSEIKDLEKQGAYIAVLSAPGLYKNRQPTSFFTISDIGLQLRKNERVLRINTNSISSGLPILGVSLTIYQGDKLIGQQISNELGEAEFESFYTKGNTLVAQKGDEYTVIDFKRSPLDLSAFKNPTSRHQSAQVFSWGPRDLYRPGETLDIFALLKDFDGSKVAAMPLDVTLYDPTGSRVVKRTLNLSLSGRYEFNYTLDPTAKTGKWRLEYSSQGIKSLRHRYELSVEEFLPERLKITLFDGDEAARRQTTENNQVKIPVLGEYLYGAPASNNKIDGFVIAELEPHPFEQWKSYSFGDFQEKIRPKQQKIQAKKLDASGKIDLEISMSQWNTIKSPLSLITNISLYESGGRPITRSTVITNILTKQLVGLEPQFDKRADDNSRASFKAILTDAKGKLLIGKDYQYSLIRENRNYYWRHSDSRGWTWEYDPLNYEVFSGSLNFDGASPSTFVVPVEWGGYRLQVQDKSGNIITAFRFSTRWSGWSNNNSDSMKPDQVMMRLNKDQYQAGDTAKLNILPAVDGLGLITLESNEGVVWRKQLDVSAKGTEIEVLVDPSWKRHDLYFTATILSPGDMKHAVAPKRGFGLLHLPLRRANAEFTIDIKVPDKVQPKRSMTAELQISGDVRPNSDVWVSVAAVDVGVLNIKRFETPDPASYLFSARRYDYQLYDVYGSIIENAGYDYSSQRFGGGRFKKSQAELVRGGNKPKNDVQIIAIQAQAVKFDSNGKATVKIDIPDFNGTLRWMAVAWSDDSYGSNEAETIVADALVTQLSRPRFLALGDKSELALDLSNLSGSAQEFKVELSVDGALKSEQWQQDLSLEDSERQTLKFPIFANKLGEASIVARIKNSDESILLERNWTLGTRSAYPSVTHKQQAVIEPGEKWQPETITKGLLPDSVQARLAISSQPPIDIGSHFDALLKYPYGCTEQSTSSGYPWVLVSPEIANRFKLKEKLESKFKQSFTEKFRRDQMEAAVERVLRRQNSSGGFALWRNSGAELNWLTVYVTDFITAARDAGALVPHDALKKSLDRLQRYVNGSTGIHYSWSDNEDYYRFATKAYAAYVLARSNRASLSQLRRLYKAQENTDAHSGLPWAHLGFALKTAGDAELAMKAFEKAKQAQYRKGYYGYYGSELRDAALLYAVLAKSGQAEGKQLLAVFDITRQRRWLSTQERNALFQAAVASALDEKSTTEASIIAAEFTQEISEKGIFSSVIDFSQLDSLESITANKSTIYASLEVIGEHESPPEPYQNEMNISRDYFNLQGRPIELNTLASGDLILVRLTASARRNLPDALIVDLLPAGLELENQNLTDASVDISKLTIDGVSVSNWEQDQKIEHIEYRDDRFIAALRLGQNRSSYLFYLARAVTPGEYLVPPPYAEDMYRPFYHALGTTPEKLIITP